LFPVYIDHVHTTDEKFLSGEKFGEDIVSRMIGIKVKFICNAFARISKGDIYEVPFDNEEDATAFVLKNKYRLIPKETIDEFLVKRKRA